MKFIQRTYIERFWSKVDRQGPDECWEWQAGRSEKGYGWFWLIDSWDQVTEDFLRSKMDYFMTSRFNGFEKLKIDYWLRLIKG